MSSFAFKPCLFKHTCTLGCFFLWEIEFTYAGFNIVKIWYRPDNCAEEKKEALRQHQGKLLEAIEET